MSRPAGLPKTGGRRKGTPNRRTMELQERIEELLGGNDLPGAILAKAKKLPPHQQVQILMELMPYVYPRKKATEIKGDLAQQITFSDITKFMHDNNLFDSDEKNRDAG